MDILLEFYYLYFFCLWVCAVGGLLKYLDQALLQMELEDPGAHVPVLLLKTFTL